MTKNNDSQVNLAGATSSCTSISKNIERGSTDTLLSCRSAVWQKHLQHIADACIKKGFHASVVATCSEAKQLVLDRILPESGARSVSFGGSVTVQESGLFQALLLNKDLTVINTYDLSLPLDAIVELRRQSLLVDFYLSSVNAVTEKGQLVLLDGTGNRCAAVQFGPKKVVLFIGRNKVCSDLESAFWRTKHLAAPTNAMRLQRATPCAETGYCSDCSSPERICSSWTITERCTPQGRIHLIFINQESGF